MPARSLAGPTSKRPQIDDVQYPRIPSRILKVCRMKKSSVVVEMVKLSEVVMSGTIVDEAIKICRSLNIWSVETPRYPA
jgi:hypothetical protein